VPIVLLLGGMPAVDLRCRRAAHRASAGQGKGRTEALQRGQDDEGGRRRRREDGRGDQSPLRQDIQGVRSNTMRNDNSSRRDILKGSSALVVGATLFAEPARAAGPAPEAVTPALI